MSTIVTRSGKGVPLTATDHDNNVNNLNTDKVETLADLSITSTATEINLLDGVTATTAELNYVDGVTSNIQTQLGTKLPLAGGTMTGTIADFTSTGIDDNATSTAITIDASENVGIGVAPETWHVDRTAIDIGFGSAFYAHNNSSRTYVSANEYQGAGGSSYYKNTAVASQYEQFSDGTHKFKVAPSGTADSAISWTTALTITNDGRGLSQFTAHAWVNLNQTGTQAIRDSHNISSISDQGTGVTRMNYSNNLGNSSTDSCTVATGKAGAFISLSTDSAGYWEGESRNANDSNEDTATFTAVVFGD